MVKAVAVLNSSEGVSGTIFFTQEGDGKWKLQSNGPAIFVAHFSG
jgi:Cu-Zn family superoxide dismutase